MPTAFRFSCFYAVVFASVAVQLPYWPLWLKARGLDETMIGQLLSLGFVLKMVVNPAFRSVAGFFPNTRAALFSTILFATLVFSLFHFAPSVAVIALLQILFFIFWVPVLPTTEYLAVHAGRHMSLDYGKVRLWGSVSFLVVSLVVGRWLETSAISLVFNIQLFLLTLAFVVATLLPRGAESSSLARGFSLARLRAVDNMFLLLAAAGLIQCSHGMFYAFGSIYWKDIGIGESRIGMLWAEGIIVEILVFLFASRLFGRTDPWLLVGMGGLAAAVRWLCMPFAVTAGDAAFIQLLHGLTFGFTHLGAIRFMAQRVPEPLSANALALYSMVVMGIFMGLSTLASGWLFTAYFGRAFWFMALLGLCGGLIALAVIVLESRRPTRKTGAA